MRPAITLTKALGDPKLLGGPFTSPSFWTWKVLGKVIDGIKLTERREIVLFEQCTGRQYNRQARRAFRRLFILVGRRGGKDRFESAVSIWRAALCADWRKHISAGEQATVLLLGADRKQAAILRRYAEGLLQVPMLAAEVSRRTENTIEFRNGSNLEIATSDSALVRGRSAIAVLGSECCFWNTDETSASSDEEIVAAAEPSMAMTPDGGLLLLGSSVYRKRGFMHAQYTKLHGNDQAEDLVWFATSRTMNPALPASVVARAIERDGARGRAEFENVWREDVSDFCPLDVIEAVTAWGTYERPPQPGIRYVAFADAASGTGSDSFALAIGHAVPDAARSVVIDLVCERKPRFVAADVIAQYATILRSCYGITEIMSDNYSAGFSSDEWERNGIKFKPCANTTAQNFLYALPLLTSKRAHLVDSAVLRTQLSGLERRVVSGHEVVGHAQRSSAHDDVAAACCGVLVRAAAKPGMVIPPNFVADLKALIARGGGERGMAQQRRERDRQFYGFG